MARCCVGFGHLKAHIAAARSDTGHGGCAAAREWVYHKIARHAGVRDNALDQRYGFLRRVDFLAVCLDAAGRKPALRPDVAGVFFCLRVYAAVEDKLVAAIVEISGAAHFVPDDHIFHGQIFGKNRIVERAAAPVHKNIKFAVIVEDSAQLLGQLPVERLSHGQVIKLAVLSVVG